MTTSEPFVLLMTLTLISNAGLADEQLNPAVAFNDPTAAKAGTLASRSDQNQSLIESNSKETLWRNRDGTSRTWFHPRVCMAPDGDGKPVALMNLQEIAGSDCFGQVHERGSGERSLHREPHKSLFGQRQF